MAYRCPPEESRFRPGQSGNPAGRPKRRPCLRDVVVAELQRPVAAEAGKSARRSKQAALVERLVDAAVGGNLRAVTILAGLLGPTSSPLLPVQDETLSERDEALIAEFERTEGSSEKEKET